MLKSSIAVTIKALLDRVSITALLISTDTSNFNMGQYGGAALVDVRNKQHSGKIGFAAQGLGAGEYEAVILDVAARDETFVSNVLPRTASDLAEANCHMVVMRPITLNPFNQENAMNFVDQVMTDHMAVIFVKILCQGREASDFLDWDGSPELKEARNKGVEETEFLDASARFADMATGYGLTFYDITLGNFGTGEHAADARASFEGDPQVFLRDWCEAQHELIASAILRVISKRFN